MQGQSGNRPTSNPKSEVIIYDLAADSIGLVNFAKIFLTGGYRHSEGGYLVCTIDWGGGQVGLPFRASAYLTAAHQKAPKRGIGKEF